MAGRHRHRGNGPGRVVSGGAEHVPRPRPASGDPFHVVRAANRCVDKLRRRVQNEELGHRGRKDDPLYRIRKLLLAAPNDSTTGNRRMLLGLRVGDPHDENLGAWLAKESVRDIYLIDDPVQAALLVDKAIAGCGADAVEEIRSLGRPWPRGAARSLPTTGPAPATARPRASISWSRR